MRRQVGRATVTMTAVGLAASGCAGIGAGITYQPAADPESEFRSAFEQVATDSVRVELSMGELMSVTGEMDAPNGAGHLRMSIRDQGLEVTIDMIVIDTDLWMNLGDVGPVVDPDKPWMHVDVAEFGDQGFMGVRPEDMLGADPDALLQGMSDLRKVDDRTFEAALDLTQTSTFMMPPGAYGDEFQEVAFSATVDDQGRIATMRIALPEIGPGMPAAMEVRYYDYGVPVEVAPPPADQVTPMPPELYGMFQT